MTSAYGRAGRFGMRQEWHFSSRFFTRCPWCAGHAPANNGQVYAQPLWLDGGTVADGTGRDPQPGTGISRAQELVHRARLENPMAALESATRINAEIIGLGDEIGTIEEGKLADITGFAGDPLSTPEHFADCDRVALVVQEGRVLKSGTPERAP